MPTTRRTDVVLLAVAVVWGSSYLTAKTATATTPVLIVLFVRYALSALGCVAVVAALRKTRPTGPLTRDETVYGTLLGLTQAAVLTLEMYGVARTSAANAGLIISLTLVLTPLLDRAGRPGGPPPRFYLAAGLCVAGVGLLVSGHGLHAPGAGDLLMLAAAVVRAGHVVLVGRVTAGRALRPLQLTTVQCVVGTALFLPFAAGGLPVLAQAGAGTWAQLVYLALFCGLFAFLAQTWAVQRTSATRASLLLGTEPVWALLVGIGFGDERLTALAALGAALIVTGTYWGQAVERGARLPRPADTATATDAVPAIATATDAVPAIATATDAVPAIATATDAVPAIATATDAVSATATNAVPVPVPATITDRRPAPEPAPSP